MWAHTAMRCLIPSRVHLYSSKVCGLQSGWSSSKVKNGSLWSWRTRKMCLPCVWEPVLWMMSKNVSEKAIHTGALYPSESWSTWPCRHKGSQVALLTRTYRVIAARVEDRFVLVCTCTTSWVRPCGLPCFPLSLVTCPKITSEPTSSASWLELNLAKHYLVEPLPTGT